jgi:hypothetical protein
MSEQQAKPTPGPWRVEPWSGGEGYRKGFYVVRTMGAGHSQEWMKDSKGRARRFTSEQTASSAIAATLAA